MSQTEASSKQIISLKALSHQFLGVLQHQYDTLAFGLAASRMLNEDQFEGFARVPGALPDPSQRLRFERAKEFAELQMQRALFAECLNILSACMDQCFTLSIVASLTPEERARPELSSEKVERTRGEFMRLPPREKINSLSQFFDLSPALVADVVAFFKAGESMLSGDGRIPEALSTEKGLLKFKLIVPTQPNLSAPQSPEAPRFVERTYRVGDRVVLEKIELLHVPATVAAHLNQLFRAMQDFGRQMEKLGG